ncbi:hypothetical protein DT065_15450 [Salicibibacter kimchii]|uniref:Uncharacterized protein n=1 Tax=Salicibibacter kimchii TaxID=2099786 RepID=A0A345C226_9BACI|nr:hypothetical protein DT065_15450 [Salicibibacter kimchii]
MFLPTFYVKPDHRSLTYNKDKERFKQKEAKTRTKIKEIGAFWLQTRRMKTKISRGQKFDSEKTVRSGHTCYNRNDRRKQIV